MSLSKFAKRVVNKLKFARRVANKVLRGLGWTEKGHVERQLRRITRTISRPVFVKVGANDGLTGDPCGRFLLDTRSWQGLLIEPVPYCADKLRQLYGDASRFQVMQCAIGSQSGQLPFYYVSEQAQAERPDLPEWYDQLGSFDRTHIVKHLDGILEPYIQTMAVEVRTLTEAVDESRFQQVDFLHVDTEGYDLRVLQSFDFSKYRPRCVLVEFIHLNEADRSELKSILVRNGYRVKTLHMDYLASR